MHYAMLDYDGRILSYDSVRTSTHNAPFDNMNCIVENPNYPLSEFIVKDGKAILDPIADCQICTMYEEQEKIQNNTDDAICALYEMLEGGEMTDG